MKCVLGPRKDTKNLIANKISYSRKSTNVSYPWTYSTLQYFTSVLLEPMTKITSWCKKAELQIKWHICKIKVLTKLQNHQQIWRTLTFVQSKGPFETFLKIWYPLGKKFIKFYKVELSYKTWNCNYYTDYQIPNWYNMHWVNQRQVYSYYVNLLIETNTKCKWQILKGNIYYMTIIKVFNHSLFSQLSFVLLRKMIVNESETVVKHCDRMVEGLLLDRKCN